MEVVSPGHIYALDNVGGGSQRLTYLRNLPEGSEKHPGVLCQEVLRTLIDRVNYLNIQAPCHENVEIVEHLRQALILFESRAARRMLEKSYAKTGCNVEGLCVSKVSGHVFTLNGTDLKP